ncbi:TPA: hypothetical protein NDY72_000299 [Enterobacter cloacae]|uniref:hypothetical protein n=1 Tax=Enterobacter cloacae TaxID=550 RepID=UPI00211B971D|nr:hypothetical protein [Enterobacter cloacae]MCQ9484368.1 hypothetical protein [Enterobacter cloacae]MCQ9527464.1 hypothetical protein [Enterobacter cloacae]MCQ9570061.1 hypothetical protein [Enterobacter cloacae]HCD7173168.1 hypothetical protein [Enterobacter cloacae]HDC4657834.1 hypothetical protein [Enterobacter cloacae]
MSVKRYEWVACDEHACHCDVVESAEGDMVDYEDYAALEARCAALAAELSAVLTDRAVILEDLDNTCFEIGMQRGEKYEAYPTPMVANHDAFLAEVRAQGVEMFAAHKRERQQALRSRSMRMSEEAAGMAADAENFAAQLRKGVQS